MAIISADTMRNGPRQLECDICIVGTGAAGLSMAYFLSQHQKRKQVIVLEGSLVNERQTYAPQQLATVRTLMTTRKDEHRYLDAYAQGLYHGQIDGDVEKYDKTFLTRSRSRVYGGTTNCWGGWTRTLQPIDFTRTYGGRKWPITRDDLEPYYVKALGYCSLRDFDPQDNDFPPSAYDDPDWWKTKIPGIDTIPSPPESFLQSGVITTVSRRDGLPDHGLAFQVTWGPFVEASDNVTIYRGLHARRVESGGSAGRSVVQTTAVPSFKDPRFDVKVTAKESVVIAAGGLETPRLLLLSSITRPPRFGEGFMIHPVTLFDPAQITFDVTSVPFGVRQFYNGTVLPNGIFTPGVRAVLIPSDEFLKNNELGNFRAMIGFGGSKGSVNFNWEQVASPANKLTLSDETDVFGDRRLRLNWVLNQKDKDTLTTAVRLVKELLVDKLKYATNWKDNLGADPELLMGDHPMGSTPMGSFPEGTVDEFCQMQMAPNIYLASSSVFPTAGWSNPTLTIVALALRLADHLSR